MTTKPSGRPAVSPDGRHVASTYREVGEPAFSIGVYPLDGGGESVKRIKPLAGAQLFVPVRWSDDGESVVYVVRNGGVDNLWAQRIEGAGRARQFTHFPSGYIYAFDISPRDGRVALARGGRNSYVVLLTEVR